MFLLLAGILQPKLFNSSEIAFLTGSCFIETHLPAHLSHWDGKKEAEESKCPKACKSALPLQALGCRTPLTAPAAHSSNPPLTLWLHWGSGPQFSLVEWIKGLGTKRWQQKERALLSLMLPVLGKWEGIWGVNERWVGEWERMSRALGNNNYQARWEQLGLFKLEKRKAESDRGAS